MQVLLGLILTSSLKITTKFYFALNNFINSGLYFLLDNRFLLVKYQPGGTMSTHRVKRQDLILALFVLFSSEYDKQPHESILDIIIPIGQVKAFLENRFGVSYSGYSWILTQIRNYEEEIGYRLFEKVPASGDDYFLRLYHSMIAFSQKRHLYITQKIKVSNALYDMITHLSETRPWRQGGDERLKLLIDAGSMVYHLADIIAEHSCESPLGYQIYTHNIAVIQRFLEPHVDLSRITVHTPRGSIDPITYSILGENSALYQDVEFDMVIQGVSFLYDGEVWVEQPGESHIKGDILRETRGLKVLILTGHEVRSEPPLESHPPFGHLSDFDRLVIPHNAEGKIKNLNKMLEQHGNLLEPEIMNWNYRIYRIRRA